MISARGNPPLIGGAPFIGFMVGCILFGCTVLQAYQYFRNYMHDEKFRKIIVIVVCLLDALELFFSANMIYFSILDPINHPEIDILWTLKGSATTTALLNIIVQSYYLSIIWRFVSNSMLAPALTSIIRKLCVVIFSYALVVFAVWLGYLEQIDSFSNFSKGFQRMIYIGYGSSAIIDTGNAVILSYLLFKTSPRDHERPESRSVVRFLVLFFIGTGVLTTINAIASMILYATKPSSVLYLAIDFSRPRLFANSILAIFNSKAHLRQQMDAASELRVPSILLFGDAPTSPARDGSVALEDVPPDLE